MDREKKQHSTVFKLAPFVAQLTNYWLQNFSVKIGVASMQAVRSQQKRNRPTGFPVKCHDKKSGLVMPKNQDHFITISGFNSASVIIIHGIAYMLTAYNMSI